jgi:small GTP-binding protein
VDWTPPPSSYPNPPIPPSLQLREKTGKGKLITARPSEARTVTRRRVAGWRLSTDFVLDEADEDDANRRACINPTYEEIYPVDPNVEEGGYDYLSWGPRTNTTTEDSYSVTRTIDGRTYHLNLTDTAGQEEYRGLWAASNLRSDAFLLVYDITNASTLDSLTYFHDLIAMEEEGRVDASAVAPVKIVAGNKCDLQSMRQVKASEGLAWAKGRRCGFMETSAREMVNIEETFALIVRRVVEARVRHANGGQLPAAMMQGVGGNNGVGVGSANPNVTFGQMNGEKPVTTTIDPRKMRRRRRQNKGGFWSRLKCW